MPIKKLRLIAASLCLLAVVGCNSADQTTISVTPNLGDPATGATQPDVAGTDETALNSSPGTSDAAKSASTPYSDPLKIAKRASKFQPDPNDPSILRDYAPSTPLPSTGEVTIRESIDDLEDQQMFAPCPKDTELYAFAESTNYLVQICSRENDPWLPKYYMGRAKDGSGEVKIINENEEEARFLTFNNGGYTYSIYRDGVNPEERNAYLEITDADDKTYAEALIYLYEQLEESPEND